MQIQSCMRFTEKIVIAKISAKVMNSFKVMQFIYKMKSSVVALFSVNLMYSVNFMSVKVMLHCTILGYIALVNRAWGKGPTAEVESSQGRIYPT